MAEGIAGDPFEAAAVQYLDLIRAKEIQRRFNQLAAKRAHEVMIKAAISGRPVSYEAYREWKDNSP